MAHNPPHASPSQTNDLSTVLLLKQSPRKMHLSKFGKCFGDQPLLIVVQEMLPLPVVMIR
jgi:hypothetical protein